MSSKTTKLTWGHPGVAEFVHVFGTNPYNFDNATICLMRNPELVTLRDKRGNSLLHSCVWGGSHPDFIGLLMKSGMDPDLKNDDGRTPRKLARGLPNRRRIYDRMCRFKDSPDLDEPFEQARHNLHQHGHDWDAATFNHELERITLQQIKKEGTKDGEAFEDLDEETKVALNRFE